MPQKKRILIIDDLISHLLYLKWIIEEGNYLVWIANNIEEAYYHLKRNQIDLILLDLILPAPGGFAFLRKAKTDPCMKGIPIIVVSKKSDLKSIEKALALGAKDYIVKPYNLQDIKNKSALVLNENQ
jgi:sigma-B regulation protein RsbU (phosphoserine phosphatase)